MAIKKCLSEVKRVAGEFLDDNEVNELLTNVELNLKKAQKRKDFNASENDIAESIADGVEFEQALNKRNLAEDTIKSVEQAQHIIDNFGKDPIKGIKALLVGIQDFGVGSRKSIGNEQDALEETFVRSFVSDMQNAGLVDVFRDSKLDLEIKRALTGDTNVPKEAIQAAEIIKKHSESIRQQFNDLGANIPKLDDWISRQFHDAEKLYKAGAILKVTKSKDYKDHMVAWREFIKPLLDLDRTFGNVENVDDILDQIYINLRSGSHYETTGVQRAYGSSSITKKASAERVLHFKDAEARHQYDIKFGSEKLSEAVLHGLTTGARNIALVRGLGTKPKANFERTLNILQNHYKKTRPDLDGAFRFERFRKEFAVVDGSIYKVDDYQGAKIGSTVRFFQSTGKLGFATISSFADLANYAIETRYQGRGFFAGLYEVMKGLAGGNNKEIVDVLGTVSNNVIGGVNQKMSFRGDMTGKYANLSNLFFRLNGLNWWTNTLKSSMMVGIARHLGQKRSLAFNKLSVEDQRMLTLYKIDSGQWDMLRSVSAIEADGKFYITAENLENVTQARIEKYLGRKITEREARNFRRDLQLTYRNYLFDRALHGTPEPDAAVRSFMLQGTRRGDGLGEILRYIGQFKQFPMAIWMKVIRKEIGGRGYSPAENGLWSGAVGLTSLLLMGTMMGYLSLSAKNLLRGKEPPDPKKAGNWAAAFFQGGGLGIYGDFLYSELNNRYGNTLQETLLGPTVGDIASFLRVIGDINEPKKAGKKLLQLAEGNVPFLNLFYTKAAYDYLIGYQLKEMLDPGYFRRVRRKQEQTQGSSFYLKP